MTDKNRSPARKPTTVSSHTLAGPTVGHAPWHYAAVGLCAAWNASHFKSKDDVFSRTACVI